MKEILLFGKKIIIAKSKVLLQYKPDDNWERYFMPMGGSWHYENGYLIGSERGNKGGILLSRRRFAEDVAISFTVSSNLPATRDLNAIYCAEWDYENDYLKSAYICGVNGWYDHRAGIEKFPENGLRALTSLFHYTPGEEIEITAGAVNGHNFLLVNDELVMALVDPNPIKNGGHVGFSPYCTSLKIKDIKIFEIFWEKRNQIYNAEF